MKFQATLVSLVVTLASASVFANSGERIIHVNQAMLETQHDISFPWKISKYGHYGLDIENETNSALTITIKVTTPHFTKGTYLGLSSTWALKGNCGVVGLKPQESIACVINPKGHVELSYLTDLTWDGKSALPFEGVYTFSKQ